MIPRLAAVPFLLCVLGWGCGRPPQALATATAAPVPRRMAVWLDSTGIDQATAAQLQRVGVDLLVTHRGSVSLSGSTPVFRFAAAPPVAGSIPVAIALRVDGVRSGLDDGLAVDVWRAIVAEMGQATPAEIVLDLTELAPGVAELVGRLSAESGVPVVPVLSVAQLQSEEAVRTARTARACLVPVYGTGHSSVRGVGELSTQSLVEKLEPLATTGARVRLGVGLRPVTVPQVDGWGDELGPLAEPENATMSTSSVLDRTFVFNRRVAWSAREWEQGESVAVRTFDASRLDNALAETNRLVLPELGGWDLIPLPPEGGRLGIGREALVRYLGGEGPQPDIGLRVERDGPRLTVSMVNPGPFATAVSGVGNWLEVVVVSGTLIAEGRGSFDRLVLGTVDRGSWQPRFVGAPTAVRAYETYLGPGEEVATGSIRLTPRDASFRVSWHVVLSSGQEIGGALER